MSYASLGSRAPFPDTRITLVLAVRTTDPDLRRAAAHALVAVYWRPVYSRFRIKWRAQPADAEDLTQEFFVRALDRDFFAEYDPPRARFRTFLRTCVDRFAAKARRDGGRFKRGGGAVHLPLDYPEAERELALAGRAPDGDADEWFEREWVRGLFADAVGVLRARTLHTAREIRFRVFERVDLAPVEGGARPSYRSVAHDLGLSVTQVTNHLAWARRQLRALVLERLRMLSGSDAEFRDEAGALFGELGGRA